MTWEDATAGRHITRALFAEIALESDIVRVHDGVGGLQWNGHDWSGVGALGAVSGISGGVDLEASDLSMALSGVPVEFRDEMLREVVRGNRVNLYQGIRDEASGTWTFEPELVHAGFIDDPEIAEGIDEQIGSFLTITVPVIAASSYMRRLTIWRRTDSDQQSLYPGDEFFAFKIDMHIPVPGPRANSNVIGDYVGWWGQPKPRARNEN